jgi:hypothetical protein
MATIKRRKGKKEEQDSNLPVPVQDNSKEIQDGKPPENTASIEEEAGEHHVRHIIIPEETLFVEDSRFEKPHLIIQTSLTLIGLGTLFAFILFSELQHNDNVSTLTYQREKDSVDGHYQRRKDSITLALAESSNVYTRRATEANAIQVQRDIRAYVVFKEISIDPPIADKPLTVHYNIVNTGKTPAKRTHVFHALGFSYGAYYSTKRIGHTLDSAANILKVDSQRLENGFVVGNNIPMTRDYSGVAMSAQDIQGIKDGKGIVFLLALIRYYDNLDRRHYTWLCVSFPLDGTVHPEEKYNDAD